MRQRALVCLAALVGFVGLRIPAAKTLLVLPLKMDTVKIADYVAMREMFTENLSKEYDGTVKDAAGPMEVCAARECAAKALASQGGDEAVFGSIRILGSKYFLSASILGTDGKAFAQQIPMAGVEDFEAASKRIAASLAKRKDIEQVADVDNVTEKEEAPDVNRRAGFYSMGGSVGFTVPVGSSYQRWSMKTNGCEFCGTQDTTYTHFKSKEIFTLGWNNWFEFKNHLALDLDVLLHIPIAMGGDANLDYLFGNSDFTPFAGGGLGFQYVFPDEGIHADDTKQNLGPAANVQAGLIMFRTYNINLILRSSYHVVMNDNLDNGPTFEIAVRTKMGGTASDKYHHTSSTTYLGMAIGAAYLIAIIIGAAKS
jgi:hypothetical protein